jgi:uncharacterized membrane protein
MANEVIFRAVIVPHRSLSRRGLRVLLATIAALCGANAATFAAIGAWPVAGFAGLELILAGVLFHLNATAARATELLLLTPDALRIVRTDPAGRRAERVLAPAWMTVQLEERPGRVAGLWLGSDGAREEIALFLGDAAKRELAKSLGDALYRWRNPRFDNPQLAE